MKPMTNEVCRAAVLGPLALLAGPLADGGLENPVVDPGPGPGLREPR